ncbi:ACP phosphodiesterase [Thermomonas brevis]
MNHLAHAWLARHSDEAILGAMLGDFAPGPVEAMPWPAPVRAEIRRHRLVDRLTDGHPAVLAARALFPDGRRRFAGIVLDVHFDHLLARDWAAWNAGPDGAPPLPAFAARVYRVLLDHFDALPPGLRLVAPRMAARDWLGGMRERASVDGTVRNIARRLSRGGDALVACLDDLRRHEPAIESAFAQLLPDLIAAAPPASAIAGD